MKEFLAEMSELDPVVQDLKDQWDGTNGYGIRRKLNQIIKEDPHVIEAYNLRHTILEEEDFIVAAHKETIRGYKAALEVLLDADGRFPDRLEWGWLENRPLLRALENYAIAMWRYLKWEPAGELMQKMLQMNPVDNQGLRYMYLAVLERIAYGPFCDRFVEEDAPEDLEEWFQDVGSKYEALGPYMET